MFRGIGGQREPLAYFVLDSPSKANTEKDHPTENSRMHNYCVWRMRVRITDLRSDWTSHWHVLMGPMTPTSTPESSSSFRDLFCQQTQGTWARKDKMQYIHDYHATLLHYLVCAKENVQMTWYNINWTCYACVWE